MDKQCWRIEQYSRREYEEIAGIPDSVNETKVCKLIWMVTVVNVNQDCLQSCDPIPSDKKTKS